MLWSWHVIYAAWPQGGGEDSPELIITDTEVSSLMDAEAQGKFIYNSLLPRRSAQRQRESRMLLHSSASAHLPGSSLTQLLGQFLSLLHPLLHSQLSSFSSIFSSILDYPVVMMSPVISIMRWFSSGPSFPTCSLHPGRNRQGNVPFLLAHLETLPPVL